MRNTDIYKNNTFGLLEEFNLLSAPIKIEELAKKLNLNVEYKLLETEISGKIVYEPVEDNVSITINKKDISGRKRFSLAHEIGHYIYDIDFDKSIEIKDSQTHFRNNTINPIEKRANKFAEKLLMPRKLFLAEVKNIQKEKFPEFGNKLGTERIYEIVKNLSEKFEVTKPAVIVRLYSLKKIKDKVKKSLFELHYRKC